MKLELLPARQDTEALKHPFFGGILLDKLDLHELLVANTLRNWRPGSSIQLSNFTVSQSIPLEQSIEALVSSGRYRHKRQGRGEGNLVLTPLTKPDDTISQAISQVKIEELRPLIDLFRRFSEVVNSVILLPNTSLGRSFKQGGTKLNGVVVELEERKKGVSDFFNLLEAPYGRGLSLYGLRGIDVEQFALNFGEGRELIERIPLLKFGDFFYDEDGMVYLAMAGGNKKKGFDYRGTTREIRERFNKITEQANSFRSELANQIVSRIGGGSHIENIIEFPYVGTTISIKGKILFISGATLGQMNNALLNNGPKKNIFLFDSLGPSPIGWDPQGIAGKLKPTISSTKELVSISQFK